MAWTTPPSWSTSQLVTATQMQVLSDDLSYLLNRPGNAVKRDNGSNYTTTSTSFGDIDGTNLKITLACSGSAVLLAFTGSCTVTSGSYIMFDFDIDGTRFASAGADGLTAHQLINANPSCICMAVIVTGLSAGSHVFKVQWRVSGGTGTLASGNGGAGADYITAFSAVEVA